MGRLIDADKFKEYIESGVELAFSQAPLKAKKVEEMADCIIADIDAQPTVEAIPKADYETRLKSDMMAMLEAIQLELDEEIYDYNGADMDSEAYAVGRCKDVIQQKINALKGEGKK